MVFRVLLIEFVDAVDDVEDGCRFAGSGVARQQDRSGLIRELYPDPKVRSVDEVTQLDIGLTIGVELLGRGRSMQDVWEVDGVLNERLDPEQVGPRDVLAQEIVFDEVADAREVIVDIVQTVVLDRAPQLSGVGRWHGLVALEENTLAKDLQGVPSGTCKAPPDSI